MVSLSKKQLACSVLLLAGCQSDPGRINNQTHTDDLIDLYLSQAASTIASMQTQLYPTPAKPLHQSSVASLTTRPVVASNLQTVGTAGAIAFVAHDGKNQTLATAVKDIIPGSWRFTFSPRISPKKKVSWTGNDQWPFVLNRLAKNYGWYAVLDWNAHSVSISDVPVAPAAAQPTAPSSKIVASPAKPAVQQTAMQSTTVSHPVNPFSEGAAVTSQKPTTLTPPPAPVVAGPLKATPSASSKPTTTASTVQAQKPLFSGSSSTAVSAAKPVVVPLAKSVPAVHAEPTQVWTASSGQTLRDTIFVWAAKAECASEARHWTVAWDTATNYSIDAPLQFSGTFKQALTGIFELYLGADVPLYAGTNSAQCAIKVDDKPVR